MFWVHNSRNGMDLLITYWFMIRRLLLTDQSESLFDFGCGVVHGDGELGVLAGCKASKSSKGIRKWC